MSRASHDTGAGRKTRVLMSVASGQEACLQGSDDKCPVLGTCRDMSQDIYNLDKWRRPEEGKSRREAASGYK
eukprot:scaffold40469_cov72-Cyclotella_meneghiniana.AAC.2